MHAPSHPGDTQFSTTWHTFFIFLKHPWDITVAAQDVARLLYDLDAAAVYSRGEVQKEWLEERYRAKVGKEVQRRCTVEVS